MRDLYDLYTGDSLEQTVDFVPVTPDIDRLWAMQHTEYEIIEHLEQQLASARLRHRNLCEQLQAAALQLGKTR